MADLSTTALHEGADAAAAKGDFLTALVHAAEALRAVPLDHRARLKVGLSLAMLGRVPEGVAAIRMVAHSLARRGFYLAAIGACRDAFAIQPGAPEIKEFLKGLHGQIHGVEVKAKTRARVPPPGAITTVPGGAEASFFKAPSPEQAILAAAQLAHADPEPNQAAADPQAVPFFSDLSRDTFVSLVERLGYHKVLAGHAVVTEGAEGTSLFVVVAGEVRISRGGTELARLGPGAMFGELALITNKPRTASVTTTLASELFEIDRRAVEEVALSHSSITEEIVGFARRRLLTNLLATSRVFTPFNEAQRLEVLRSFVSKVVPKGAVIIEEGSEPKGLYLVLEGEVEVTKTDAAGDRMVLAYLREGDVFGEIGLVNAQPTTATVTAAEKSVLLVLDRSRFQALTANHPKILEYLSTLSEERLAENKQAMSSEGVILDADDLIIL